MAKQQTTETDKATAPETPAPTPQKKYRVIFTHLRSANGNDHFNGEILTAEEIGNAELHLSRGAIEEVFDAPVEAPKEEKPPES